MSITQHSGCEVPLHPQLAQKPCLSYVSAFAGRDAGDTYSKLAEVHVKQDSKADAAQAYVEASKAYQRVDKSSKIPAFDGSHQ